MKRKYDVNSHCENGGIWKRGPMIGAGGFGSVFLAKIIKPRLNSPDYLPSIMAVKSAPFFSSDSLVDEKFFLGELQECPSVLKCYGDDISVTGHSDYIFNLFLEYAAGGTVGDLIRKSGGRGLLESLVRKYTKSVVLGLKYLHESGYVHCDMKPDNILLVMNNSGSGFEAKIGDFGLTKWANSNKSIRGTSMYFAPESVVGRMQEAPSDIWALGCAVLEMITARSPWLSRLKPGWDNMDLMRLIGSSSSKPDFPCWVSEDVKDFMECCFVRNPAERWSAKMLLNHPFLLGEKEKADFIPIQNGICSSGSSCSGNLSFIPIQDSLISSGFAEKADKQFAYGSIYPVGLMC